MKGIWSMVFYGSPAELKTLLAGAERLRKDPCCGRFCGPLLKCARDLRPLPGGRAVALRAEGTWKNALLGLTDALETLHSFAPETEAACRAMTEEHGYVDYLAPGVRKSVFTEDQAGQRGDL